MGQQHHWSERGRATSVANADALACPRRSVLALARDFAGESNTHSKPERTK